MILILREPLVLLDAGANFGLRVEICGRLLLLLVEDVLV